MHALSFGLVVLCALGASPVAAQLDIGTIVYHESYDGESAFPGSPTTPEVDSLGLGGLEEGVSGPPDGVSGFSYVPPDRVEAFLMTSVPQQDNASRVMGAVAVLPSFGPGDAWGMRGEFDSLQNVDGGNPEGGFQTGVQFMNWYPMETYDQSTARFVAAQVARTLVGTYVDAFEVAFWSPAEVAFNAVPIADPSLFDLPFTIDLILDRAVDIATAQIRFFDGETVAFEATTSIGPFPTGDTDYSAFGQYNAIGNAYAGQSHSIEFLDLKVGAVAPEPRVGWLLAFALAVLGCSRRFAWTNVCVDVGFKQR